MRRLLQNQPPIQSKGSNQEESISVPTVIAVMPCGCEQETAPENGAVLLRRNIFFAFKRLESSKALDKLVLPVYASIEDAYLGKNKVGTCTDFCISEIAEQETVFGMYYVPPEHLLKVNTCRPTVLTKSSALHAVVLLN